MTQHIGSKFGLSNRLLPISAGICVVAVFLLIGPSSHAQSQDNPTPAYNLEKASPPGKIEHSVGSLSTGQILEPRISLKWLIMTAYTLHDYEISGGPNWIDDNLYKVSVTSPRDARLELQKLLQEKFNLKYHFERREMPIYLLIVAKGGPKIHPINSLGTEKSSRVQHNQGGRSLQPGHGLILGDSGIYCSQVQLNQLARQLSEFLNRRVIDETGLVGLFDITATWSPDESRPAIPDSSSQMDPELVHPIIFKVLPEQLGLELKPDKGLGKSLIIDSVQNPF